MTKRFAKLFPDTNRTYVCKLIRFDRKILNENVNKLINELFVWRIFVNLRMILMSKVDSPNYQLLQTINNCMDSLLVSEVSKSG